MVQEYGDTIPFSMYMHIWRDRGCSRNTGIVAGVVALIIAVLRALRYMLKNQAVSWIGCVANLKFRARGGVDTRVYAEPMTPNKPATNATCPATSPFGTHRTCPLRIMFIVSIP